MHSYALGNLDAEEMSAFKRFYDAQMSRVGPPRYKVFIDAGSLQCTTSIRRLLRASYLRHVVPLTGEQRPRLQYLGEEQGLPLRVALVRSTRASRVARALEKNEFEECNRLPSPS